MPCPMGAFALILLTLPRYAVGQRQSAYSSHYCKLMRPSTVQPHTGRLEGVFGINLHFTLHRAGMPPH